MIDRKHKKIKQVRDLEAVGRKRKGQRAYVDGLFISFQSRAMRENIPRSPRELASISKIARDLANEIDTLLELERAYREGMVC